MTLFYLLSFFSSFSITLFLVALIFVFKKKDLTRFNHREKKKISASRLGGLTIWLSFILLLINIFPFSFFKENLSILGLVFGSLVLVVMGTFDDFKNLSAKTQIIFQLISALIIIIFGVDIGFINNPFGNPIYLNTFNFEILNINGHPYFFTLFSDLFAIFWIILIINVINWMDGIDGVSGGVGLIGALSLFFISLLPEVNQPLTASLSILLAGSLSAFLIFNFKNARVMLGTAGSAFLGFSLAVLSIMSGGKLATALLILGFPILDAFWVIFQRIKNKKPIWKADQNHFHHRLLALGFSQTKITLIILSVCALFAIIAISANTYLKAISLLILAISSLIILIFSSKKKQNIKKKV
jgi:UDP-GlcNAc:undecaprenyl-phosphate GlcNAc-1-phosphate transferase